MLKWLRRQTRKRSHAEYLWRNIHSLRQQIIDDVLYSTRDDGELDTELLKHKARLIRKYSRRLKTVKL